MSEGIACPLCGTALDEVEPQKRDIHVNACLEKGTDRDPTSKPQKLLKQTSLYSFVIKHEASANGVTKPEASANGAICEKLSPYEATQSRKRKLDVAAQVETEYERQEMTLGFLQAEVFPDTPIKPEPGIKDEVDATVDASVTLVEIENDKISMEPDIKAPDLASTLAKPKKTPRKSLSKRLKRDQDAPKKRSMPSFKTLRFGQDIIAVDAFCYGAIPGVSAYFLTHFHSDHYGGLGKKWSHGPIYCTPATANLCVLKLGVSEEFLRPVPIDSPFKVEGINVRFLDANHCPGSAIILFNNDVLHTGDFRATDAVLENVRLHTTYLRELYLDTTYLDPKRRFPSQDVVIRACAEYCRELQATNQPRSFFTQSKPTRILVLVGTYTIGKERLAISIADILGSKMWATPQKKKVLMALHDAKLSELLDINDGLKCQVHLANMSELSFEKLNQKWTYLKKHYTNLIAFVPTGWTFSAKNPEFNRDVLHRKSAVRGPIRICRVPYSEHSSFAELESFCQGINVREIIPTVSCQHHDIMRNWQA